MNRDSAVLREAARILERRSADTTASTSSTSSAVSYPNVRPPFPETPVKAAS